MNVLQIKAAVRERDRHRCTLCGMSRDEHFARYGQDLHVHRVVPRSLYRVDESCVTVCRACHGSLPKTIRGRGPEEGNCAVKIHAHVYRLVRTVAAWQGLSASEYLGQIAKSVAKRDLGQILEGDSKP